MATETITQINQPAPFIEAAAKPYLTELTSAVGDLKQQDFTKLFGPQFVAGPGALQTQAEQLASGLGGFQPFLQTAAAGANTDLVKSFGRVEDSVLFDDVADRTVDGLKAGFSTTNAVQIVELPKISSWIQFLPKTGNGNGIEFAFSRKDILNFGGNTGNIIKVTDNFNPADNSVQNQFYLKPLNIRCTNIYLTANGDQGKILVGLTTIDRSEFTEVVETFLEVD